MCDKIFTRWTMWICTCLIVMLFASCSSENDEVYQAPWEKTKTKVGVHSSEQIETADQHDGKCLVYKYKFKGKGPVHKMVDVRKYKLDHFGSRGSDISVDVHIEWPEEKSGLSKDGLAKVRKTILWMAFAHNPEIKPYSIPEALGETEESLRKRNKELWAKEGKNREIDEYGLQPSDWTKLVGDALSRKNGRIPVKDDGRITTKLLEFGMSGIKDHAKCCYVCDPPEKMHDSWYHYCSQWCFTIDLRLEWPFGVAAKDDAKWYERPILYVYNDGYDRDGGHGYHGRVCAKVFSLPDGIELGIEDYFAKEKLGALFEAVIKRLQEDGFSKEELAEVLKSPLDLESDYVFMIVKKEGITWSWCPDTIFSAKDGTPSAFFKWEELESFKRQ